MKFTKGSSVFDAMNENVRREFGALFPGNYSIDRDGEGNDQSSVVCELRET
jgi:hypothetical protein